MPAPARSGSKSTIIGWQGGLPALLRPGGIPAEAIAEALGQRLTMPAANADPEKPAAPGMLTSHYAPGAPVRLNARAAGPDEFLIGFGPVSGEITLSPSGDLVEAAANLFDALHRADATGRPIAVAPVPDHGMGRAINDRLRRAAAPR